MDILKLYCRNHPREYRLAFDLAVNFVDDKKKPIIAAVESSQLAIEIIRRVATSIYFIRHEEFIFQDFIQKAQAWTNIKLLIFNPEDPIQYGGIIWVGPNTQSNATLVETILKNGAITTKLAVISPGFFYAFLPNSTNETMGSERFFSTYHVLRLLSRSGWKCQSCVGLHSIRSLFYSIAARFFEGLGRPDWRDRCLFSSRSVYQATGLLWPFSTLIVTYHLWDFSSSDDHEG